MFPYYQPPKQEVVVEVKKRKSSCSFCGNDKHNINNCDKIGMAVQKFINIEDKNTAKNYARGQTNSGLERLLFHLGCTIHERLSKPQLVDLMYLRWVHFRVNLQEMICTGETIRNIQTIKY